MQSQSYSIKVTLMTMLEYNDAKHQILLYLEGLVELEMAR